MKKEIEKNLDYEIFSLPEKEVRIVEKYMTENDNLRIKIRWKVIKHKCPKFGSFNTCRVWNWYETVIANHMFLNMFLSNYKIVQLVIFKCLDCEKNKWWKTKDWKEINWCTFEERFSFLDYKCSYSNVFKNFIIKEWEFNSISELSRKFQVSESKVYTVINSVSIEEVKEKVKSSVDHYHLKWLLNKLIMEVFNMSNWMIKAGHYDKIIKDIMSLETLYFNKYRTDRLEFNVREFREYKPNDIEYKPITLWYFLSKKYINLLLMKSEDLTNKQKHRLNQILFEFDPKWYLKEVYLWKELLNEAVKTKDMSLIEKLISDFKSSIQYKIKTCANTLEKWKDEIKNFFETWITNAFTEWKNTKAKLLKRMAYWYKSKTNYMKRLLICL